MSGLESILEYIEMFENTAMTVDDAKYRTIHLSLLMSISDRLNFISDKLQSNHDELIQNTPDLQKLESLLEKQWFCAESNKELSKAIIAASCIDSHLRRGIDYTQIVDELRSMNTVITPYLREIS
jgi:hypothetical protein